MICRNLDQILFQQGLDEKGVPVAVLGYSPNGKRVVNLTSNALRLSTSETVAGAWCKDSFAVKVRGEKLVAKLHLFATKMREGDAIFAGTFLNIDRKDHLSGVIIALQSSMRTEHKQAIWKAQRTCEDSLRLRALSRVDELRALCLKPGTRSHIRTPGSLRPVWADDAVKGEVAYVLYPDEGVNLDTDYVCHFRFEDIRAWMLAEKKYLLRGIRKAA